MGRFGKIAPRCTLVIDSVGVKRGPFAMVGMCGTPITGALHVVERHRLLDYDAANETEERRGGRNRRGGQSSDPALAPDPNYKDVLCPVCTAG